MLFSIMTCLFYWGSAPLTFVMHTPNQISRQCRNDLFWNSVHLDPLLPRLLAPQLRHLDQHNRLGSTLPRTLLLDNCITCREPPGLPKPANRWQFSSFGIYTRRPVYVSHFSESKSIYGPCSDPPLCDDRRNPTEQMASCTGAGRVQGPRFVYKTISADRLPPSSTADLWSSPSLSCEFILAPSAESQVKGVVLSTRGAIASAELPVATEVIHESINSSTEVAPISCNHGPPTHPGSSRTDNGSSTYSGQNEMASAGHLSSPKSTLVYPRPSTDLASCAWDSPDVTSWAACRPRPRGVFSLAANNAHATPGRGKGRQVVPWVKPVPESWPCTRYNPMLPYWVAGSAEPIGRVSVASGKGLTRYMVGTGAEHCERGTSNPTLRARSYIASSSEGHSGIQPRSDFPVGHASDLLCDTQSELTPTEAKAEPNMLPDSRYSSSEVRTSDDADPSELPGSTLRCDYQFGSSLCVPLNGSPAGSDCPSCADSPGAGDRQPELNLGVLLPDEEHRSRVCSSVPTEFGLRLQDKVGTVLSDVNHAASSHCESSELCSSDSACIQPILVRTVPPKQLAGKGFFNNCTRSALPHAHGSSVPLIPMIGQGVMSAGVYGWPTSGRVCVDPPTGPAIHDCSVLGFERVIPNNGAHPTLLQPILPKQPAGEGFFSLCTTAVTQCSHIRIQDSHTYSTFRDSLSGHGTASACAFDPSSSRGIEKHVDIRPTFSTDTCSQMSLFTTPAVMQTTHTHAQDLHTHSVFREPLCGHGIASACALDSSIPDIEKHVDILPTFSTEKRSQISLSTTPAHCAGVLSTLSKPRCPPAVSDLAINQLCESNSASFALPPAHGFTPTLGSSKKLISLSECIPIDHDSIQSTLAYCAAGWYHSAPGLSNNGLFSTTPADDGYPTSPPCDVCDPGFSSQFQNSSSDLALPNNETQVFANVCAKPFGDGPLPKCPFHPSIPDESSCPHSNDRGDPLRDSSDIESSDTPHSSCIGMPLSKALPFLPPSARKFSVVYWNVATALHTDPTIRRRKFREISSLASKHDIVFLQEVHGTPARVRAIFRHLQPTHRVFTSFCTLSPSGRINPWAGGVAAIVAKQWLNNPGYTLSVKEVCKGRVLRLFYKNSCGSAAFYNVHNFGLSQDQLNKLEAETEKDRYEAERSPHFQWFFGGDNNIHESDERGHSPRSRENGPSPKRQEY